MTPRKPIANLPKAHLNSLQKVRKLINWLLRNREIAWQKAEFNVQSKLSDLRLFKTQWEAAEKWGREGHYHLLYSYRDTIRNLIPGEKSKFQNKRQELIELMDKTEAFYTKHFLQ